MMAASTLMTIPALVLFSSVKSISFKESVLLLEAKASLPRNKKN